MTGERVLAFVGSTPPVSSKKRDEPPPLKRGRVGLIHYKGIMVLMGLAERVYVNEG